ncbi:unnamed protein product, partial [Polarella glacialis]
MTTVQVRKMDELQQVLKEAAVEEEICAYMIDVLRMTSVEDFVRFVSEAAYETELLSHILIKVASFKSDPLQLSRLRTAWRVARATLNKTEQRRIAGQGAEDMDEPLDASTQDSLLKQWAATYSQNLAAWLHPADSLLGRIYREFQRNTPTVISIKKVKSLLIASRPSSEREVNLGGNVKLHLSDGVVDGLSIANCVDYYWGLRILGYARSIVGQYKTSSMQTPGAQVVYAPLSVNMDYADICLKRSQVWQGLEPLSWLRTMDEATRGRQVELMRMGWPQGEALQKALTEMELQWTVGPVASQTKRGANETVSGGREEEGEGPAKKVRTAATFQSKELCKNGSGIGRVEPVGNSTRYGMAPSSSSGDVGQTKIVLVAKAEADFKSSEAGGLSSETKLGELPAGISILSFVITDLNLHGGTPWILGVGVPILVISLCDGVGGLPIGLLAMGATIYTVAILSDDCAKQTSMRYLENVVHVKNAETVTGPLLRGFLRSFPDGCPILVGGTCPWSDRGDMRPAVFSEVPRIASEIEAAIVALRKSNQVVKFVENTWKMNDDFSEKASDYFRGGPVITQAGEFGYVHRDRAWWGVGTNGNMATMEAKMPVGVTLVEEKGIVRLVWQGKKPIPEEFQAEVNLSKLTQGALRRFEADGRRFPAISYEPQSLMWSRTGSWRPPCPTERASLMMLPHDVVTSVSVDSSEETLQREARQNNLVGNSFHIPSLMMVLILLFQTIQAKGSLLPEPTWVHLELEFDLQRAVQHAVLQPGLGESWTELIEPTALLASMHGLFLSQGLQLDHAVHSQNLPPEALKNAARRMKGTMAASFFDDTGIVDSKTGGGSTQASVGAVYNCMGADLVPPKRQPMAAQRMFLGLLADVGRARNKSFMYFDVKPFTRRRFSWAATAAYGKCGRGGRASLVQRQYFDAEDYLTPALTTALAYLQFLALNVPPRNIRLLGLPLASVKVYSDASFEPPMKEKLGYVIFMNDDSRPIVRTAVIPEPLLAHFIARKTQITPYEAFLASWFPSTSWNFCEEGEEDTIKEHEKDVEQREVQLEVLCAILASMGSSLSDRNTWSEENRMVIEDVFIQLEQLSLDTENLSLRIRCLIRDILDLRMVRHILFTPLPLFSPIAQWKEKAGKLKPAMLKPRHKDGEDDLDTVLRSDAPEFVPSSKGGSAWASDRMLEGKPWMEPQLLASLQAVEHHLEVIEDKDGKVQRLKALIQLYNLIQEKQVLIVANMGNLRRILDMISESFGDAHVRSLDQNTPEQTRIQSMLSFVS